MKILFHDFFGTIRRIFSGKNILAHVAAIVITYVLVITNFDWGYLLATQNPTLRSALFPAVVLGGLIPIFVPLSVILIGTIRRNKKLTVIGFAIGQAALLGSLISSAYKSVTGRIQPDLDNLTDNISNGFQFGFWEHGIFWGWPSSHTTIAFSMAICIAVLYSHKRSAIYAALFYAFYIGIGISTSIHWFSDFIAGAFIGSVIGIVVGRSFKKLLEKM